MGRSEAKGFAANTTALSLVRLEGEVQSPSVHTEFALWGGIWDGNLQHDVQEMWMLVCLRYQFPLLFYLQSIITIPRWWFKALQNSIYMIDQIKIHVESTKSNMLWHRSNMWRIAWIWIIVFQPPLWSQCSWKKYGSKWEQEAVCSLHRKPQSIKTQNWGAKPGPNGHIHKTTLSWRHSTNCRRGSGKIVRVRGSGTSLWGCVTSCTRQYQKLHT